jgi:hypothetical protein
MNNCTVCKKKLGLMPFTCKCGKNTCINHQWPSHECSYDYKSDAKQKLMKENPKITNNLLATNSERI